MQKLPLIKISRLSSHLMKIFRVQRVFTAEEEINLQVPEIFSFSTASVISSSRERWRVSGGVLAHLLLLTDSMSVRCLRRFVLKYQKYFYFKESNF